MEANSMFCIADHSWIRSLTLAAVAVLASFSAQARPTHPHVPGTLANRGFEGQPMKSVFYFGGQWRGINNDAFYDGPVDGVRLAPATNACKYTLFPWDGAVHFGWSEPAILGKREHTVNLMLAAGVNVVNMSYWGPPTVDRWAFWAPMHTAPGANEELFDAAVGKPLLIAPYIEDGAATIGEQQLNCDRSQAAPEGQSPGFSFANTFPGTPDDPAPQLVEQVVELIDRFLLQPRNSAWPAKWAQMYDRDGRRRYVVSLIHVGSNRPDVTHETFARGFTWAADRVYALTGVRVGFTLDVLPLDLFPRSKGPRFIPSPKADETGSELAKQAAVLAIQPFIAEKHTSRCRLAQHCDDDDSHDTPQALKDLVEWKRAFVESWVTTGIPVILDVSSGYDARTVFPDKPCAPDNPEEINCDPEERYGNNQAWRTGQETLLHSLDVRGVTANSWNGYTEAMAIVPSCLVEHLVGNAPPGVPACNSPSVFQDARKPFDWFRGLVPAGGSPARLPAKLVGTGPVSGFYSDPVTLQFTLTSFDLDQALFALPVPVPVAHRAVHFRLGKQEAEGTTDANGVVTVSITIDQRPADNAVPLRASFGGDAEYSSAAALPSAMRIKKEITRIQAFDGGLIARLLDDDGQPVRNRIITFRVGSGPHARKCWAVTGADGIGRCKIGRPRIPGKHSVHIEFAGDAYYEPAAAQREIIASE